MARFLIEVMTHDDDGDPGSGFKYYFYESGTTTPKDTYSDEDETTANTNPILADAWGRMGDIWFSGAAKLVIKTAADVIVPNGTFDPIYAVQSGGGGGAGDHFEDWSGATTYATGDIVTSGDYWYQSQTDNNTNNVVTDETYWVFLGPIYIWNAEATYKLNNFVYDEALLYRSKVNSNTGNKPWTSKAQFEALGLQYRHEEIGSIAASGSKALDLTRYNSFSATLNGNATFTFANEPETDEMYTFDVILHMSGLTGSEKPTFPTNVLWTRGYLPVWSGTGTDAITIVKYPNDSNYYAQEYNINAKQYFYP